MHYIVQQQKYGDWSYVTSHTNKCCGRVEGNGTWRAGFGNEFATGTATADGRGFLQQTHCGLKRYKALMLNSLVVPWLVQELRRLLRLL